MAGKKGGKKGKKGRKKARSRGEAFGMGIASPRRSKHKPLKLLKQFVGKMEKNLPKLKRIIAQREGR